MQTEQGKHTAAIDELESSPGDGWVTSAPKMIVGRSSITGGVVANSLFLPPTYKIGPFTSKKFVH